MSDSITIHQIFLSKGHDFKGRFEKGRLRHETSDVESVECVQGRGLVGDRYFDFKEDYKGQLTLISVEAIEEMEAELEISVPDYKEFRRNIVVSGVDLNALVGKNFRIGEVELSGSEQCKPCAWMNESIGSGAHAALKDRGGLRCRILSGGTIRKVEFVIEPLD